MSLCLLVLLPASAAFGQKRIRAEIPFDFYVSGKQLPAGTYRFIRADDNKSVRIIGLNNMSALTMAQPRMYSPASSKLQYARVDFRKIGDQFYLSEVWISGAAGFELPKTAGAKEGQLIRVPAD
jgi:hypothetical protein